MPRYRITTRKRIDAASLVATRTTWVVSTVVASVTHLGYFSLVPWYALQAWQRGVIAAKLVRHETAKHENVDLSKFKHQVPFLKEANKLNFEAKYEHNEKSGRKFELLKSECFDGELAGLPKVPEVVPYELLYKTVKELSRKEEEAKASKQVEEETSSGTGEERPTKKARGAREGEGHARYVEEAEDATNRVKLQA